jgi:predicted DNA-binding protein
MHYQFGIEEMFVSDICAKMSDMASSRISVRIPQKLTARLRARSRARGSTESDLVREALEKYLETPAEGRSAYELATQAGVIGSMDGPSDLSTNRGYFKDFGKKK